MNNRFRVKRFQVPYIDWFRNLNEQQLKTLSGQDFTDLKDYLDSKGIPLDSVNQVWDKTKEYSIQYKPNKPKELTIEDLESLFLDKLKNHRPNYSGFEFKGNNENHLLVLDIADAHFGKLSSSYETNETYNLEVAKKRVLDGVEGIISKAKGFGVERVLFVVGNDVLHIDNPFAKTTSGTFQNTDGMFYDMFNTAFDVYVEVIEKLMIDYNVDVVFNPSNHDYMLGWTFVQKLQAWFKDIQNITFNVDMSHRKYYQYGVNMIGTNHGDGAKMENIPLLMAQEQPQMWANTKYRYCYLHHIHHKQRNQFMNGKDYIGVTIEYLRSPSSSDSWHHRNGYTGNKKAIEGFIHHKEYGQIARLTHYF